MHRTHSMKLPTHQVAWNAPANGDTSRKVAHNTLLLWDRFDRVWELRLHGHCIARLSAVEIALSHADWVTATTANRLAEVAETFSLGKVNRKDGEMILTTPDGRRLTIPGAGEFLALPWPEMRRAAA